MSDLLSGFVYHIELPDQEQRVMKALAEHGKDDGTAIYPGVGELAWKLGKSERTIQRILRRLEEKRLLIPVAFATGGRGHPTQYEMHLENGVRKPAYVRANGEVVRPPDPLHIMTEVVIPAPTEKPQVQEWTDEELQRVAGEIMPILRLHPSKLGHLKVFLRQKRYAPPYLVNQAIFCAEYHVDKGHKPDIRLFGRWLQDDATHEAERQEQLQLAAESERKPDGHLQPSATTRRGDSKLTPEQAAELYADIGRIWRGDDSK